MTTTAASIAIGAVVAPPDAVAATAILSRLNMPRRIVTILEGESLVNDASGLVLYKFAVAAVLTGAGADVDDPVGLGDGVLVVLDDDECVTQVPQSLEGLDESGVVALVQTDTGLVQDVEDAHQA